MVAYYYRFVIKIINGITVRINSILLKKLLQHHKKERKSYSNLQEVYNKCVLQNGQCIITDTQNKIETNHIIPANYKNPFIHLKFLQVLWVLAFPVKKIELHLNEAYVWGNGWSNGYYHFVVEDLPKLLFMQTPDVQIYSWSKHTSSWRKELFELFSIQSTIISQPILVDNIYYISNNRIRKPGLNYSTLHPTLALVAVNSIKQLIQKWGLSETPQKKIVWISRKYTFDRSITNENECIELLQKNGVIVHVLYPEKISVSEQIKLVHSALWIIGPHGAGLANMVFTSSAGLIEIGPPEIINNSFISLAASFNRPYHYLKAKPTHKWRKRRSNLLIEPLDDFAAKLQEITGLK